MKEYNIEVMRIRVVSTSDPTQSYTIEVRKNPDSVACNCKGFTFARRCKHIKFYKWLITSYLHETPGIRGENGDE